jgi:uncharacterized protein YbaR (Trm112 family)
MHILLTDHLTCPRCGPRFGLIVMAEDIENRHIREGSLGCANCRSQYRITAGVADLRGAERLLSSDGDRLPPDPDRAFRLAALMGVTRPGGMVLVVGPDPNIPGQVSSFLAGVHVVGAGSREAETTEAPEDVSRVTVGRRLPLRDRSMRAVAIVGMDDETLLIEAARLPAAGSRLVVDGGPESAAKLLRDSELDIQLEQDGIVVAAVRSAR